MLMRVGSILPYSRLSSRSCERAVNSGEGRTRNKKATPCEGGFFEYGAAGRIRTHDPLVRSQVLYPTELQPLKKKNYTI